MVTLRSFAISFSLKHTVSFQIAISSNVCVSRFWTLAISLSNDVSIERELCVDTCIYIPVFIYDVLISDIRMESGFRFLSDL